MQKIFKLYPHFIPVFGKNGLCIYNLINGDIYDIENKYYAALSRYSNKTNSIEIIPNYKDIYMDLEKHNFGVSVSKNIVMESLDNVFPSLLADTIDVFHNISSLFIEITNQCNLKCIFCNTDVVNRSTSCKRFKCNKIIKSNELCEAIDSSVYLGVKNIFILGGEPLIELNKTKAIIKAASKKCLNIYLFSNGTIPFDSELLHDLKIKNVHVILQIVSIDDELGYVITGKKEYWQQVKSSLKILSINKISFSIKIIVGSFNEKTLKDIISFAYKKNINYSTTYIMPSFDNKNCIHSKNLINNKNRLIKVSNNRFIQNQRYQQCFSNILCISADGYYIPCPSLRIHLGDIHKDKLYDVLNSSKYCELRTLSKDKIEKCSSCKYRYGCNECRAIEFFVTGKINGMHNCEVIHEL